MCDPQTLNGPLYSFHGFMMSSHEQSPVEWEIHSHSNLEILLPLNPGRAEVTCYYSSGTSQNYTVGPDQLCIIPAYQTHKIRWPQQAELVLIYVLHDSLNEAARLFSPQEELKIIGCYGTSDPLLRHICLKFRSELLREDRTEAQYLESLKSLLVLHLLQHYSSIPADEQMNASGLVSYKLKQALDYIHAHCRNGNLRVTDVAVEIGLSQYYFCHLFKDSMGISPYQYILRQRIEWAKHLLQQSTESLMDVALDCGFSSQGHLTRQFHRLTGFTPKQYRDRHKHLSTRSAKSLQSELRPQDFL